MVESAVKSSPTQRSVVIACASVRRNALLAAAGNLKRHGIEATVIAGVEQTMLPLLKASFRHGSGATYMLCGSPELHGDALARVHTAVEGNGVPGDCVWVGALDFGGDDSLTYQLECRLAALGVSLATPPAPPNAKPRAANKTMVAGLAPASPAVGAPTMAPPPIATTPPNNSRMGGATPSGAVRIVPPTAPPAAPPPTAMDDVGRDVFAAKTPLQRFFASRAGMACAGATIVLLGSVAVMAATGDDDTTDASSVATASVTPQTSDAETSSVAAPSERPTPAVNQAVASDAQTPTATVDSDTALDAVPTDDVIEELIVDEQPTAAEELRALPADSAEVYAALTRQSIRALDILLIAPMATKKRGRRQITSRMNYDKAKAYCDALSVDGVTAWRLPGVGELGSLTRSNMLPNGRYWTATKADAFGSRRVVWNTHSRRMGSEPARWRGGRVVCVRLQRPQDGGPN